MKVENIKAWTKKNPILTVILILFVAIGVNSVFHSDSTANDMKEKDPNSEIRVQVSEKCDSMGSGMHPIYQLEGKSIIGADCVDEDGRLHALDLNTMEPKTSNK